MYNPHDYDGETLASRIAEERELNAACEASYAEALALELADAAAQDAIDAVTIYEYVDNSWLGIADGPVTIRRAA